MGVVTLTPGLTQVKWDKETIAIADLPFKSSLSLIYKVNSAKSGWQTGVPDDTNSILKTLVKDTVYLFKISSSFDLQIADTSTITNTTEIYNFSVGGTILDTELDSSIISSHRYTLSDPTIIEGSGTILVKDSVGNWVTLAAYNTYIQGLAQDAFSLATPQIAELKLIRTTSNTCTGTIMITPV